MVAEGGGVVVVADGEVDGEVDIVMDGGVDGVVVSILVVVVQGASMQEQRVDTKVAGCDDKIEDRADSLSPIALVVVLSDAVDDADIETVVVLAAVVVGFTLGVVLGEVGLYVVWDFVFVVVEDDVLVARATIPALQIAKCLVQYRCAGA